MRKDLNKPDLKTLQLAFKKAITSAESVSKIFQTSSGIRLSKWIDETPKFKKPARLEVYHYAYFARILESMEDDFSEVRRMVGPKVFSKWIREYLEKFPSRYTTLAEVGKNFPKFISQKKIPLRKGYLLDLARLEWSLIQAFYSPKIEIGKPNPKDETLALHPGTQLLMSGWNLFEIWSTGAKPVRKKTWTLVFRDAKTLFAEVKSISEIEFKFLSELKNKIPLDFVLETLEEEKGYDSGALLASIQKWSGAGVFGW